MKKLVIALSFVALLSACGAIKKKMGFEKQAPDETTVTTRAPLTLPPEYDLKPVVSAE